MPFPSIKQKEPEVGRVHLEPGREQQNWAESKGLSLNMTSKLKGSPVIHLSALSHTLAVFPANCSWVTQLHCRRAGLG